MNRLIAFTIAGSASAIAPGQAFADTGGASSPTAGILLGGMMLMLIVVCLVVALKVFSYLRGGELASAWQILSISFVVLIIAEAVRLVDMLGIASVGDNAVMLVRLVGLSAVMIGVARIKKVLS